MHREKFWSLLACYYEDEIRSIIFEGVEVRWGRGAGCAAWYLSCQDHDLFNSGSEFSCPVSGLYETSYFSCIFHFTLCTRFVLFKFFSPHYIGCMYIPDYTNFITILTFKPLHDDDWRVDVWCEWVCPYSSKGLIMFYSNKTLFTLDHISPLTWHISFHTTVKVLLTLTAWILCRRCAFLYYKLTMKPCPAFKLMLIHKRTTKLI